MLDLFHQFDALFLSELKQRPFLTTRYFCRSVEYDEQTHLCVLSEEDSVSQKDDLRTSSSPTHHLYDLVCLDNRECSWNIELIFCKNIVYDYNYEGHLESKERFGIKKYLLIIGKKKNMQVLSHTFTYFST